MARSDRAGVSVEDCPGAERESFADHLAKCAPCRQRMSDAITAARYPAQTRATSLSPQEYLLLDQWGRQLHEAFVGRPYLVGSVARAESYRDVDVRMLLPEAAAWVADHPVRLRAVNLAVTLWGRQVTGLPIDFQFQPDADFHAKDGQRRSALGIRSTLEATDGNE